MYSHKQVPRFERYASIYIYTISSTRNSGWDSFRKKKKKKKRNKQRKEGRKNKKGREKLKFNGKIFIHVRGKGVKTFVEDRYTLSQ